MLEDSIRESVTHTGAHIQMDTSVQYKQSHSNPSRSFNKMTKGQIVALVAKIQGMSFHLPIQSSFHVSL